MTNYNVSTNHLQQTGQYTYTYNSIVFNFSDFSSEASRARAIRSIDEAIKVAERGGTTVQNIFSELTSRNYTANITDNISNIPNASPDAQGYFHEINSSNGTIYMNSESRVGINPDGTYSTFAQEVTRVILHELAHIVFPSHSLPPIPQTAPTPENEAWARMMRTIGEEFSRFAPTMVDPVTGETVRHYNPGGWSRLDGDKSSDSAYAKSAGEGGRKAKEGNYTNEAKDKFDDAEERQSPLVLDLDGDGLDLIALANSNAFFDLDNDGFVERVGWVGADDGLLAIDLDGNGFIEGRTELFGGSPSDGFASLRLLDSNADNLIDANDAEFANLKVWRDLDGDGVSDAGELQSLTEAGIASISLASVHLSTPDRPMGSPIFSVSLGAEVAPFLASGLVDWIIQVPRCGENRAPRERFPALGQPNKSRGPHADSGPACASAR